MTITEETKPPEAPVKPGAAKQVPRPFVALSRAAFKGYIRDKANVFWMLLFPLMFLVIFGLLFADAGGEKTELGVVGDGPVVSALEQTGAVELTKVSTEDEALQQVKDGDLPGYVAQDGNDVTLRFAGSDQTTSATLQGLVNGVADKANVAATGQAPRFTVDAERVEDASLEPIQFLTPGLLSWAIAMGAVFGSALTVVIWRKNQVLRRLRLAPVSTTSVLGSRLAVGFGTAIVQTLVFVGVASLPLFGFQLAGQWWLALPLILLGTLSFFSIGMLVGAFTKTEEAASGAGNLILLPMAFLSGSFFPIEQTPSWMQAISNVFPMRHLNEGMSAVLVRGEGVEALLVPSLVLIGFTVVVGAIAAWVFKWDDA